MSEARPRRQTFQIMSDVLEFVWEMAKRALLVGAVHLVAEARNDALLRHVVFGLSLLLWMWASLAFARVVFPDEFPLRGTPPAGPRSDLKQLGILAASIIGMGAAFFFVQTYTGVWPN